MRNKRALILMVSLLVVGTSLYAQKASSAHITAAEAKNHIGKLATVCGVVASTHYAASSRGGPTFLNLDKPYPGQIFTIVIWRNDRGKFGQPEEALRGKDVCVTGRIKEYREVPEIIVQNPTQIKVVKRKNSGN